MKSRFNRLMAAALGCLILAAGAPPLAHADRHHTENRDQRQAREALARGEVMPLERILALVRPKLHDEIVGIKFEAHDGVWYYEFRTVDAHGRLTYHHADARTGTLVTVENHP
ncbi:PepSY domain-containing protein [Pseudokordiimonas caeni]|uniref:PepSY domain-containing protein n=1 Tax=Pseudokordiimonas caeni TaxID=2997908 RepID=UPI002810A1F5|nr:hypothetical protein [Pseudokordiimonas caeni]